MNLLFLFNYILVILYISWLNGHAQLTAQDTVPLVIAYS